MNFLIYFVLWILLQLVEVNCQMTPSVLSGHTATLINKKLYILGGLDAEREFFYLNVSVPFNTKKLSWKDLSNINGIPPPHNAAASVTNNDKIFLYGGVSLDVMNSVYIFDSQSDSWNVPSIAGADPARKSGVAGIVDNKGKMYLWGGETDEDYANDMLILDTINLSWEKGSMKGAPTPRTQYGAALLPNENIIYMGGINARPAGINYDDMSMTQNALPLNEVYIYDTNNDNWSTITTSGDIPSNRAAFSTVLGLDGQRIIIFGGLHTVSGSSLYVLDLTNFNWYVPKISGKTPKLRAWHKANVIGKYMVVTFGQGYNKLNESDVLLLDISNNDEYIWTTVFDPSFIPPPISTPIPSFSSKTDKDSPAVKAGMIVGPLIGGVLLLFGSFFLFKWCKNNGRQRNNPAVLIPHNNNEISTLRNDNNEMELVSTSRNENTANHESILISAPNNENTEPIIPRSENTANHESILISAPNNENTEPTIPRGENTASHESTAPRNESTTNPNHESIPHEPTTPVIVINTVQ